MLDSQFPFPHHRLDVYRVALEFALGCKNLSGSIPRGHRSLADQVLRSSSAIPLLVAEGANRKSLGTKRQRFEEARGECGESAAAIELMVVLGFVATEEGEACLQLAGRIGAMLTGLIRGMG